MRTISVWQQKMEEPVLQKIAAEYALGNYQPGTPQRTSQSQPASTNSPPGHNTAQARPSAAQDATSGNNNNRPSITGQRRTPVIDRQNTGQAVEWNEGSDTEIPNEGRPSLPVTFGNFQEMLEKVGSTRIRTKWTTEEEELLLKGVALHGKHWSKIKMACGFTRTGVDLKDKFRNCLRKDEAGTWERVYKYRAEVEDEVAKKRARDVIDVDEAEEEEEQEADEEYEKSQQTDQQEEEEEEEQAEKQQEEESPKKPTPKKVAPKKKKKRHT